MSTPIGMIAEMQLGGTWTDISNFLHQRDTVGITRGRQNEASGMQAANQGVTLKNQDARFTLRNPGGAYYPNLLQNVPTRISIPSTYGGLPTYLRLQNDDLSAFQASDLEIIPVHVTSNTAAAATTLTVTIPATASGNTIVVYAYVGGDSALQTVSTLKLGTSNLSVVKAANNGGFVDSEIWYLQGIASGQTSVVVTATGTSELAATVYELPGLVTPAADKTQSLISTALATWSSGTTAALAQSNEIAIGGVGGPFGGAGATLTGPGLPWINTSTLSIGGTLHNVAMSGYNTLSSVAAQSYSGSSTAAGNSVGVIATFKATIATNLGVTSGILSVRIDCKITDWQQNHALIGKYGTTAKSWGLWTNGTGKLTFDHFDGSSDHFAISSIPVPYFSGRIAIRVDYNVPAQTVTFYTAPNMSGSWTQLGTVQTTPATVLSSGAGQPVTVGIGATNVPGMYGEVYEAQVLFANVNAPALVHVTTGRFTTATGALTIPSTTSGNTLICAWGSDGTTGDPQMSAITLSPSGSADNWVQAVSSPAVTPAESSGQWVDPSCLGSQTTLNFTTVSGSGTLSIFLNVYEFSGVYSPTPVWTTGLNGSTTSTPWTVSTSAAGIATQLAIGTMMLNISGSVNPTITGPGAPWTNQAGTASGGVTSFLSGYQVLGSTGTVTFNGTAQAGTGGYEATIVTYRPSSSGSFTLLLDPIFTAQTAGATSFVDAQNNTWNQVGTSEITNKQYRFHGEWAQSPKFADSSNKDIYVQSTAYGINQRLQNANTPLNSPMRRAYVRLPANLRLCDYWSMEDGVNSKSLGSQVGGSPMTFVGAPTLASNSSFVCSAPIPVLNGATFTASVRTSAITWQDNITRFLFSVPASDDTNNTFFCNIYTNGTCALARVQYGTGGVLNFSGYDINGVQLFNQNASFGLAELANCRISAELVFVSPGTSNYGLWVLTANGTVANGFHGAYTGNIGGVTQVTLGNGLIGSAVGHLSVQGVDDGINDLINPLIAWVGETAGTRYARLCSEEGLPCRIMGPPETSALMGAQAIDTLTNILQQCEATDQGQQYEPRDTLALGYRTLRGFYNQPVMSSVSFVGANIFSGFGSTADTQLTVNDVTANAADGSIARQTMPSGFPNLSKMNTNPPNSGWPATSGSVTSPGAFAFIAQTPPIAPGTYNIKWAVSLSGTLAAGDANNFQLYLGTSSTTLQLLAQSVNGFGANLYQQPDVLSVVIPAGGWSLIIKSQNAGTASSVYGGIILPQDPGISSVQTSTSPNPASDSELNSMAGWTLHVRSIDDDRYPNIPFHISRTETPSSIFLLDIGDYLNIPDGPTWLPNGQIKQLAAGFVESYFPAANGTIEINGIPELPYEVAVSANGAQRLASAGSFLSVAYTYGNTSISVAPYFGSTTVWTQSASDWPFNIVMAGMILQVTAVGAPGGAGIQTLTVAATSVNGIVKNLPVGTPVQVASPLVVAL